MVVKFKHDFLGEGVRQTIAWIENKDDILPFHGVAKCHPKDNFSRRVGVKKALRRLLTNCSFNKEERKNIWQSYFEQTNQHFENL